jgi:hypothetical protein
MSVIILLKAGDNPIFLPRYLTEITNRIAVKISNANTALNSSPPDNFKKE